MDDPNQKPPQADPTPAQPPKKEPPKAARSVVTPGAIGKALPVVEIRDDLVICQHGTHYAEVSRADLDGDDEPTLSHRVHFHEDGRRELVGGRVVPSETTKVIGTAKDAKDAGLA